VWTDLAELAVVDTPPYFHENLMHRINTELESHATSAARRRSFWDLRGMFQPRAFAAAAVILIILLGGIGYVETQPAALGPFGILIGHPESKPATLVQPKIEWMTGVEGTTTLRVQFQLNNATAETGAKYTIAIGNGIGTVKNTVTQLVPANGKVDALIPVRQEQDASDNAVSIRIYSLQDGAQSLVEWHGTLPPR
jgi:hypothetical protein